MFTRERLKKLVYDDVEADVECVADAENPFQEGYAIGFNDCRYRVLAALVKLIDTQ